MNTIEIPESFTPQTLAQFMLDHIFQKGHLQLWDQESWLEISGEEPEETAAALRERLAEAGHTCGTTGCVAGWATILTAPASAVIQASSGFVFQGHRRTDPQTFAESALGLSASQADWLFRASRTLDEVTAALEAIAEGNTTWDPKDFDAKEWAY